MHYTAKISQLTIHVFNIPAKPGYEHREWSGVSCSHSDSHSYMYSVWSSRLLQEIPGQCPGNRIPAQDSFHSNATASELPANVN